MPRLILETLTPALVALLTLFSFFVLLRGHAEPGGGFVGGLLLSATIALYALACGPADVRELLWTRPERLVAAGLMLAVLSAVLGHLLGAGFLAPWEVAHIPDLVTIGAVIVFDLGVYLVVHGTVTGILLALLER